MTQIAQALTIAGSDSGGGAGIQADLKTFQMRGVYGMSVLAAVTAQNTLGVQAIHGVPLDIIRAQIDSIAEDFSFAETRDARFQVAAFKIGMLGTAEVIECVAEKISGKPFGRLVLDPVMVAKGGAPLLQQNAVSALKRHLLPLADVLTPNLPEAEALTGIDIQTDADAEHAARILQEAGVQTVVIKGGHSGGSQSEICRDWVFMPDGQFTLESPRFPTPHTHGTGCTFSACLTAELAKGESVEAAIRTAKQCITAAISQPINIGHGHGPVNHWAMRAECVK